jgi:hypothetical protein
MICQKLERLFSLPIPMAPYSMPSIPGVNNELEMLTDFFEANKLSIGVVMISYSNHYYTYGLLLAVQVSKPNV